MPMLRIRRLSLFSRPLIKLMASDRIEYLLKVFFRYFGTIETPPSLLITGTRPSLFRLAEAWRNRLLKAPEHTKILTYGEFKTRKSICLIQVSWKFSSKLVKKLGKTNDPSKWFLTKGFLTFSHSSKIADIWQSSKLAREKEDIERTIVIAVHIWWCPAAFPAIERAAGAPGNIEPFRNNQ